MTEKQTGCRTVPVAIGGICLTVITAMATFFIVAAMMPKPTCDLPKLSFPKDKPEWHDVDRMEVPEKNLIISRPVGSNKCYVLPKRTSSDDDVPRPLVIINDPLSFQMMEHIAGSDAAAFCNGVDSYMARELRADEAEATARARRQAGYGGSSGGGGPAPAPAPAPAYPAPQPATPGYEAPQPAPGPAATSAPAPAPAPAPAATYAPAPAPAPAPAGTSAPAPAPGPAPSGGGGYGGAAGGGGAGGAAGGAGGSQPANAGGVAVGAGQSAAAALSALQGSQWTGTGIFGTAQNTGKSALEMDIDQRTPRCTEVLLDCVDHVGQVQSCYTWVNGVLWMDRKCTDSKQFVIRMTKPPGRILKIAQQQWIICLKRRNEGKTC